MVTNPLTVDFSGFSPRREFVKPTFGQTLKASLGYTYDPIIESIKAHNQFGNEREEGYNPFEDFGQSRFVCYAFTSCNKSSTYVIS